MKTSEWLKTKKAIAGFAIVALVGGSLFIGQNFSSRITGNAVLNSGSVFSAVSLIGVLLILCSVVLGVYSLKQK